MVARVLVHVGVSKGSTCRCRLLVPSLFVLLIIVLGVRVVLRRCRPCEFDDGLVHSIPLRLPCSGCWLRIRRDERLHVVDESILAGVAFVQAWMTRNQNTTLTVSTACASMSVAVMNKQQTCICVRVTVEIVQNSAERRTGNCSERHAYTFGCVAS